MKTLTSWNYRYNTILRPVMVEMSSINDGPPVPECINVVKHFLVKNTMYNTVGYLYSFFNGEILDKEISMFKIKKLVKLAEVSEVEI